MVTSKTSASRMMTSRAGGDAAVLVAADLAGVAADLGGEVGLGPAVLLAQLQDALAKRHDQASLLVLTEPF